MKNFKWVFFSFVIFLGQNTFAQWAPRKQNSVPPQNSLSQMQALRGKSARISKMGNKNASDASHPRHHRPGQGPGRLPQN